MGGRLFYAPLMKPKKILDIGTGIGSWPIEMGEHHIPGHNHDERRIH